MITDENLTYFSILRSNSSIPSFIQRLDIFPIESMQISIYNKIGGGQIKKKGMLMITFPFYKDFRFLRSTESGAIINPDSGLRA